jgi:hypothetical protein
MHHDRLGTVREVEAPRGAFYYDNVLPDVAAMTLGASKAISRTAWPPGAWNGDGASVSRFLKLFIERGMYPALL